MKILAMKALRDLKGSRLRTASIVMAIALSMALGIGLVNATEDVKEMFSQRFEETHYEDFDIQYEMANITGEDIEDIEGVQTAVHRIYLETQAEFDGDVYKTHWISSPYHDEEPYAGVNGVQILDGGYPASADARECMVGNLFADGNDVGPGDTMTVQYHNLTIPLEVSGIISSPEYLYVVDDAGWPQPSLLMPMFTTYEMTIDALGLNDGASNELVVRVTDGYDAAEVKERVEAYLSQRGVVITLSLLGTEELDYQFSNADVEGMGDMGLVFGVIIMGIAAVIIFNSMTRLIATQRPYIGVMSALGGKPGKIVAHYCLFGLFMGLFGALIGVPLGILFSMATVDGFADIMNIPDRVYTIHWIYPLQFTLLGVGIATVAALLGSLRVMKIGPREALTSHYHAQDFSKKPLIERLMERRSGGGRILTRIPVRNLGRQRLRTGMSMIALAVSLVLVFACTAMVFGFDQPLQRNYDEYEKWDVKATLIDMEHEDAVAGKLDELDSEGIRGEPMLDTYMPLEDGDGGGEGGGGDGESDSEVEYVAVQAFQDGSRLRSFHVIEGDKDFDDGVLVGTVLAKHLDIGPGDKVTFVVGNDTVKVKVTGITGELMDSSFLMTLEKAAELFGTGGMVNAIIADMGDNSRDELESSIRERFAIAGFAYTEDVIDGMGAMLEDMEAMLFLFILFGAGVHRPSCHGYTTRSHPGHDRHREHDTASGEPGHRTAPGILRHPGGYGLHGGGPDVLPAGHRPDGIHTGRLHSGDIGADGGGDVVAAHPAHQPVGRDAAEGVRSGARPHRAPADSPVTHDDIDPLAQVFLGAVDLRAVPELGDPAFEERHDIVGELELSLVQPELDHAP
jgi:putative ABC transport system permease protein